MITSNVSRVKQVTSLLILMIGLSSPSVSKAWGTLGHWTVARIAELGLNDQTRSAVATLLDNKPLAYVSVWPDEWRYRDEWKFTSNYHFDTVPADSNFLRALKEQNPQDRQKGGVVLAILRSLEILRNAKYTGNTPEVRNALIFLIHFVGDIHQPLHVGRPGDRGGNMIAVNWMGKDTNLHSVWDTQLIMSAHSDFIDSAEVVENSKTYAAYLMRTYQAPQQTSFNDDDVSKWIDEQMPLREGLYVGYQGDQEAYIKNFAPHADYRLLVAGQRLSGILNSLFAPGGSNAPFSQLKKDIELIIGKLENIIRLLPAK